MTSPTAEPATSRARGDRGTRLRPGGRDRVPGPHQSPGLACLRAAAARHAVAKLDGGALLQPGAERPRLRPDGGRSLRQRRRRQPADGPLPLRHPATQGRAVRGRRAWRPVAAVLGRSGRREGQGPAIGQGPAARPGSRSPRWSTAAKTQSLGALGGIGRGDARAAGPIRPVPMLTLASIRSRRSAPGRRTTRNPA